MGNFLQNNAIAIMKIHRIVTDLHKVFYFSWVQVNHNAFAQQIINGSETDLYRVFKFNVASEHCNNFAPNHPPNHKATLRDLLYNP
jgi:hypothetical protein